MSNSDQRNTGYALDLKIESIGEGQVRGVAQFPTQEGFIFQISVVGREQNVQQFNGSRILQASFQPMSAEEVQATITELAQQHFEQQREQWSTRIQQLYEFVQNASPEQLARLEGGWKQGFPHQDVFKYLNQGIRPTLVGLDQSPLNNPTTRFISFDMIQAPSTYGRLYLEIDPILDDVNTSDIYYPKPIANPEENAWITATTTQSETNDVTMTLSRVGGYPAEVIDYAEGLSSVEGNRIGGIKLTLAALGLPCTYGLTIDTYRQWNQVA